MAEPDWAKVLNYLYRNDGRLSASSDLGNLRDSAAKKEANYTELISEIPKKIDIEAKSQEEVESVLDHLKDMGLITTATGREWAYIKLEKNGFDVAHDRENTKNQTKISSVIAVFTLALIISPLVAAWPNEGARQIAIIIMLGLVLFLIIILWQGVIELPGFDYQ